MKIEHEYDRGGAWVYLAGWEVHRGRFFGRCEPQSGIAPFDRLVAQVMRSRPIKTPAGSSGLSTTGRPIRASARSPDCTHSIRSIVQRKCLPPNDSPSLAAVAERLWAFERYYATLAIPFEWTFTRRDLEALLRKMTTDDLAPLGSAALAVRIR